MSPSLQGPAIIFARSAFFREPRKNGPAKECILWRVPRKNSQYRVRKIEPAGAQNRKSVRASSVSGHSGPSSNKILRIDHHIFRMWKSESLRLKTYINNPKERMPKTALSSLHWKSIATTIAILSIFAHEVVGYAAWLKCYVELDVSGKYVNASCRSS